MNSPDPDLSDVFRLLYEDEDDWGTFEDDEPRQVPLGGLVSEVEVETVESDLDHKPSPRYTREYFKSALDSLLDHQSSTARVFPAQSTPKTVFTSTDPIPPPPAGYAPYSYLSLLVRLQTFRHSTFSSHPEPLTPIPLALKGWRNDGRETLTCEECQGSWYLSSLEEIKDDNVKREVAKRLGKGSQHRHMPGCPWRAKCSPDDLYAAIRASLHPMITQSLSLLADALEPIVSDALRWISPLTPGQVNALSRRLSSNQHHPARTPIFETALSLAFFAWYPYSPKQDSIHVPSPAPTDIVCCRICRRRIGLWSFSKPDSPNTFDLVSEHLSWCPIHKGEWWLGSDVLQEKKRSFVDTWDKDWARVSDKLVEKPWRKRRKEVE